MKIPQTCKQCANKDLCIENERLYPNPECFEPKQNKTKPSKTRHLKSKLAPDEMVKEILDSGFEIHVFKDSKNEYFGVIDHISLNSKRFTAYSKSYNKLIKKLHQIWTKLISGPQSEYYDDIINDALHYNTEEIYLGCECRNLDHTVRLTLTTDADYGPELFLAYRLINYRGIIKRIITAMKYIFGKKDVVINGNILDYSDIPKLKTLLDKYDKSQKKYFKRFKKG